MQSIKALRGRIQSVKGTQQTTRAMKMVSAAKLRRASEAISNQKPYSLGLQKLTRKIAAVASCENIAFIQSAEQALTAKKKLLLVAVTLDRGLCGSFNVNVCKMVMDFIQKHHQEYEEIKIDVIGRKGFDFFKNTLLTNVRLLPEYSGKVTFLKAQRLSDDLLARYLQSELNEVKFVYNEFVNAIQQSSCIESFLPFELKKTEEDFSQEALLVEPSADALFSSLIKKNFQMQVFRILLESQAGEHGSRMAAMDNATKNAEEMIDKLSLLYNKQRQAVITRELLEIVSGSESQKRND
jgi:F-type H+-transporting ATPase subunit gamma